MKFDTTVSDAFLCLKCNEITTVPVNYVGLLLIPCSNCGHEKYRKLEVEEIFDYFLSTNDRTFIRKLASIR